MKKSNSKNLIMKLGERGLIALSKKRKSDYISNLQYDRPNHEIINEKISSLN